MEAVFTPATHWIKITRRSAVIVRESNGGEVAIVWPVAGRGEERMMENGHCGGVKCCW